MPTVFAVANQKGGSGKTTTSMNLAGGLAAAGFNTLVVDADKQASATEWRNRSEESLLPFSIVSMPHADIHTELARLLANSSYEAVLVDCPPGGAWAEDQVTISAILAADVVVMPVRPTPMDYLAAAQMSQTIGRALAFKPDLRVFLLVSCRPTGRDQLARVARETAEEIFIDVPFPVEVFETEISNRAAFAKSPGAGMTVLDYEPESKAAEEIAALTREVIEKCLTARTTPASFSRA